MKTILGQNFYTTQEVCKILGVTQHTLSKLRKRRVLIGVRIGVLKYISAQAIKDYVNGVRAGYTEAEAEALQARAAEEIVNRTNHVNKQIIQDTDK